MNSKRKGKKEMSERYNKTCMYSLDFKIVIIKKGEILEAMFSKFILMMPKTQFKNQESSKFQESKSRSIKASFKNQD